MVSNIFFVFVWRKNWPPLRCRQTPALHWPHPCTCPWGWWWGACTARSSRCRGSRRRPRRGSPCARPTCSRQSTPKSRRQNPEQISMIHIFKLWSNLHVWRGDLWRWKPRWGWSRSSAGCTSETPPSLLFNRHWVSESNKIGQNQAHVTEYRVCAFDAQMTSDWVTHVFGQLIWVCTSDARIVGGRTGHLRMRWELARVIPSPSFCDCLLFDLLGCLKNRRRQKVDPFNRIDYGQWGNIIMTICMIVQRRSFFLISPARKGESMMWDCSKVDSSWEAAAGKAARLRWGWCWWLLRPLNSRHDSPHSRTTLCYQHSTLFYSEAFWPALFRAHRMFGERKGCGRCGWVELLAVTWACPALGGGEIERFLYWGRQSHCKSKASII